MMIKKIFLVSFLLLYATCYGAEDVNILSLDNGIKSTVVIAGTAPTALPEIPLAGRKAVAIQNLSSTTIYIGDSTVTANENSTGGLQLIADGDSVTMDLTDNIAVYGIVATGTSNVVVLEAR